MLQRLYAWWRLFIHFSLCVCLTYILHVPTTPRQLSKNFFCYPCRSPTHICDLLGDDGVQGRYNNYFLLCHLWNHFIYQWFPVSCGQSYECFSRQGCLQRLILKIFQIRIILISLLIYFSQRNCTVQWKVFEQKIKCTELHSVQT